ncbi:MAG TPA: NYN domain-containing protein [Dehalococcoidia bacterium]|nr:NYN domain-containing protein [Dehalococcoidia bacterium]
MNFFKKPKQETDPRAFKSWQVIPTDSNPSPPVEERPPDSADAISGNGTSEAAEGAPARRRSRRPARPRSSTAGKTDKELLALVDDKPEEKPASRSRAKSAEKTDKPASTRSRGGRGAKTDKAVTLAPPPDLSGLSSESRVIAELMLRQTSALEAFAEKQTSALRDVQDSLVDYRERLEAPSVVARLPRCGIFVDVPNIIYTADRLRARIDFGKLLNLLSEGRELVRASAYAPISDDPSQSLESQRFVQPFVDRGYKIVTKPLKRFADGSIKANFDVELAMDILTMADRLDVICLVSGDGDFRRLIEIVESKGVRVEVVAFGQSTAAELKNMADEFIELGQILDRIT